MDSVIQLAGGVKVREKQFFQELMAMSTEESFLCGALSDFLGSPDDDTDRRID